MNKFIISTDSNCDLPADICEKYNIPIISLNYCFDNIIYGSENQMKWVGLMNNIIQSAEEIVLNEIVYA